MGMWRTPEGPVQTLPVLVARANPTMARQGASVPVNEGVEGRWPTLSSLGQPGVESGWRQGLPS